MYRPTLFSAVVSMLLVGVVSAADTFTVDIVPVGSTTIPTSNGAITFELVGTLTQGPSVSQGLAFFSLDLEIVGPQTINLGNSQALLQTMSAGLPFEKNRGYSNDFHGTPIGNDLVQSGGGQNTIGNDPNQAPFEPFPTGPVQLGVGFTPATFVQDSLFFAGPLLEGEYTLRIKAGSLHANVISLAEGGEVLAVEPVDTVVIGQPLVFNVQDCETDPPVLMHANGLAGETRPFSGYIDPRRESNNGQNVNQGPTQVTFVFDEPVFDLGSTQGGTQQGVLTTAAFTITTTGGAPIPTVLGIVTGDNMTVQVNFSPFLGVQEWMTVIAGVEDACGNEIVNQGNLGPGVNEPDRIDVGFLPGDIRQDGLTSAIDLVRWRQYFLFQSVPLRGLRADFIDTDRNGSVTAIDLVAYRQLLLGTGNSTRVWNGKSMNNPQP